MWLLEFAAKKVFGLRASPDSLQKGAADQRLEQAAKRYWEREGGGAHLGNQFLAAYCME